MSKRNETILIILAGIVLVPPMLAGLLIAVGITIENLGQWSEQHDRCLKNATNGYEIRECR